MIAFDAFIGAPDRHAMNWGVLSPLKGETGPVRYSPIFDTARGLFREFSDADLLKKVNRQSRDQFLQNYAERSCPIFSSGQLSQKNHFALIKWITDNCSNKDHQDLCTIFSAVDISKIEHMLQRWFRRIITQHRIELIRDLLVIRIGRLQEEVCK